MTAAALPARDRAALGLVAVAIGTKVFTDAGKQLGWTPIMITVGLYVAGRIASLW